MKREKKEKLVIYTIPPYSEGMSPLVGEKVIAGFPSPADNYIEEQLDLNKYCVRNPAATFFVRVDGDSMINAGIKKGDILVVDRSADVKSNDIVIAVLNGEFTLKRLLVEGDSYTLLPENPRYSPIKINREMGFEVWGRVMKVIHEL